MAHIYAKVVDGQITEYPVSREQFEKRGKDFKTHIECKFTERPAFKEFHYSVERPKLVDGIPVVGYEVYEEGLQGLIARIKSGRYTKDGKLDKKIIDRLIYLLEKRADTLIEGLATSLGYKSSVTAVSYEFSSVAKYAEDAKAVKDYRDLVWQTLYEKLNKFSSYQEPVPTDLLELEKLVPLYK